MIPRSDIVALIEAIDLQPDKVKRLNPKDREFYTSIKNQASHYGYVFSLEQSKTLQRLYRTVYANIGE